MLAHIDWVTITFWAEVSTVAGMVTSYVRRHVMSEFTFLSAGHGVRGYKELFVSDAGISIGFSPGKPYCTLYITGTGRLFLGDNHLFGLLSYMTTSGISYKVPRLDIAFDTSVVDIRQVLDVFTLDGSLSGVIPSSVKTPARSYSLFVGPSGATVYLGSRESDKYMRIYSKLDDNSHPYVRFELEIKDSPARYVLDQLLQSSDFGSSLIHSYIMGYFFVDSDWYRLAFFSQPLKVPSCRRSTTIESSLLWFKRMSAAFFVNASILAHRLSLSLDDYIPLYFDQALSCLTLSHRQRLSVALVMT